MSALAWRLGVDLRGRRRATRGGLLLLAAGAALLLWQGWAAWQTQQALDAERAGLARLARAAERPPAPAMSAADIRRHAQFEPIARHLAVSWDGLLDLLENTGSREVQLVHLAPDAETGRIALTARARSAKALSAYMLRLEASRPLKDVQLLRHEHGEERSAALEFDIEAGWRRSVGLAAASSASSPQGAP